MVEYRTKDVEANGEIAIKVDWTALRVDGIPVRACLLMELVPTSSNRQLPVLSIEGNFSVPLDMSRTPDMPLEYIQTTAGSEVTSFGRTGIGRLLNFRFVLRENMTRKVFPVSEIFLAVVAVLSLSPTSAVSIEAALGWERLSTPGVEALETMTRICTVRQGIGRTQCRW